MRHRILFSVDVETVNDAQAYEWALKLEQLLQQPYVRMALEADGIRLSGDSLTVYAPQRA